MNYASNECNKYWELFFSVVIPLLFAILVAVLICCAPSIDTVVFGM